MDIVNMNTLKGVSELKGCIQRIGNTASLKDVILSIRSEPGLKGAITSMASQPELKGVLLKCQEVAELRDVFRRTKEIPEIRFIDSSLSNSSFVNSSLVDGSPFMQQDNAVSMQLQEDVSPPLMRGDTEAAQPMEDIVLSFENRSKPSESKKIKLSELRQVLSGDQSWYKKQQWYRG